MNKPTAEDFLSIQGSYEMSGLKFDRNEKGVVL